MPRPIFLTGLARGGTNILARMLIAGGASQIAIHAFQPWYKSLRNAIVAKSAARDILNRFDPQAPFADGFFDDAQLAILDLLHRATLDIGFDGEEWPNLLERLQSRAAHDASDLIPAFHALAGAADYRTMMDRILKIVPGMHGGQTELVGTIDTWIIDLLPVLARAYPEAQFVVVIRDPRAVVASTLKFLDSEPGQVGNVLSILRQWRKFVALAHVYQRMDLFAGRFSFVRYEDEVVDPEGFARALCDRLKLDYRQGMIDFSRYEDSARDRNWSGNSAFTTSFDRIDHTPAQRWRKTLAADALSMIEFCCGPDMEVCGYTPVNSFERLADDARVREFLVADGLRDSAWRTDSGDAAVEYERESLRRQTLSTAEQPSDADIRRAFLSKPYFGFLRSKGRLFAPA